MSTPHLNDYGTIFQITLQDQDGAAVDVSAATTKQIIFEKPDGVVEAKTASWVTDGTDGKIKYAAVADDLDVVGAWKIQGRVTDGSTWEYRSERGNFTVAEILGSGLV